MCASNSILLTVLTNVKISNMFFVVFYKFILISFYNFFFLNGSILKTTHKKSRRKMYLGPMLNPNVIKKYYFGFCTKHTDLKHYNGVLFLGDSMTHSLKNEKMTKFNHLFHSSMNVFLN